MEVLSTSADNNLLDWLNSSYPTQPHSLIAHYLKAQGFAGRQISNKTRIAKGGFNWAAKE